MNCKSCAYLGGAALVLGIVSFACGRSWPAAAQELQLPPGLREAKHENTQALLKRKAEAARKVYEALAKAIKVGRDKYDGSDVEWSRLWLEAEMELQPQKRRALLEDHRERVRIAYEAAKAR